MSNSVLNERTLRGAFYSPSMSPRLFLTLVKCHEGRNKLHSQELEGMATASKLLLAKGEDKGNHMLRRLATEFKCLAGP
jgi:hypothetical protein